MSEPEDSLGEVEALLADFQAAAERGDPEGVEAAALGMLHLAAEQSGKDESQEWRLIQRAREREAASDWAGAEAAHHELVALAAAKGESMREFKARHDLRALYALQDRQADALDQARLALAAARRSEMEPLIGAAGESLALLLLRQGETAAAREVLKEIIAQRGDGPGQALARARALVVRAECAVQEGDAAAARADLDAAWPLLQPYAEATFMAGYQGAIAHWWGVTGEMLLRSGDLAGAAEALDRSVSYRTRVAFAPQLEGPFKENALAKALHRLAEVRRRLGDVKRAELAQRESAEIRQRIGLPPLPNLE